MKEAFWGLGILIFGLFGIIMISLFGNITVTNQLNYTTLKNDVEASMYDALDKAYYRSGFCLCSDKNKKGKVTFNNKDEYELKDIVYTNGNESCSDTKKCMLVKGDYRLNKKVFIESLMRRLASVVTNNKDYKIIVKEIIEYPPKVSVRIDSKDAEFSPTEKVDGEYAYTIVNQMDALIETWDTLPTPSPTPSPTPLVVVEPPSDSGSDPESPSSTTPPGSGSNPVAPAATTDIGPNGCFLAGTKIASKNGYTEIDKLKKGDYVLTYNEDKKINEYKKVVNAFILKDINEELYTIRTDDGEIVLTGHHRLYTYRNGEYQYIAAERMNIGDVVMYSNGEYHKIKSIQHNPIKKTVYNLETEDNHNFYVGEKNILVHNVTVGFSFDNDASMYK